MYMAHLVRGFRLAFAEVIIGVVILHHQLVQHVVRITVAPVLHLVAENNPTPQCPWEDVVAKGPGLVQDVPKLSEQYFGALHLAVLLSAILKREYDRRVGRYEGLLKERHQAISQHDACGQRATVEDDWAVGRIVHVELYNATTSVQSVRDCLGRAFAGQLVAHEVSVVARVDVIMCQRLIQGTRPPELPGRMWQILKREDVP
mmetsp:Transcript_103133/g.291258  ORF Transcript_103133/g.291258 Transcript_103133/m.291258 type:complete len:203 (+) Transcript_103133:887-1495(+)